MTPTRRWMALLLAGALGGEGGCASYNAMWNAEQHAKDARRLEHLGQMSEARTQWAQAAAKAKRVPTDKGLVLQVEGLARSDACQDIGAPLAQARARVTDQPSVERIDLAEAECAVAAGDAARADAALTAPLASRNAERRSRAEYVAGRAAIQRSDYEVAILHFNRSRVPGGAGRALVAQQRTLVMRATQRTDLQPIAAELNRLHTVNGTEDAGHLLELITQVQAASETPGASFHTAELARDSLQAIALAGQLFLETAARDTGSLFAPKALIAALTLLPERRDSIMALLDSRYAGSPYTRAFHGDASLAYAAAEDSLAREMGMRVVRSTPVPPAPRLDVPPPIPGRRGPPVDRP